MIEHKNNYNSLFKHSYQYMKKDKVEVLQAHSYQTVKKGHYH